MKNRRFRVGEVVERRYKRRWSTLSNVGRITKIYAASVLVGGRAAMVTFLDGSEQMVATADLRKSRS